MKALLREMQSLLEVHSLLLPDYSLLSQTRRSAIRAAQTGLESFPCFQCSQG